MEHSMTAQRASQELLGVVLLPAFTPIWTTRMVAKRIQTKPVQNNAITPIF